jgi:hypothetical protein
LRKAFAVAWLGVGTLFLEPGELGVIPGRPGPTIIARGAFSAGARFPVLGARRTDSWPTPWALEPAIMIQAPRKLADDAWTGGGLFRLDVVRALGEWEARGGIASHVTGWVAGGGGMAVSNMLAPTIGMGRHLGSRVRLDAELSVVRALDSQSRRGRLFLGVACGI